MEIDNTMKSQKREITFIAHVFGFKIFVIVKMIFSFRIDDFIYKLYKLYKLFVK